MYTHIYTCRTFLRAPSSHPPCPGPYAGVLPHPSCPGPFTSGPFSPSPTPIRGQPHWSGVPAGHSPTRTPLTRPLSWQPLSPGPSAAVSIPARSSGQSASITHPCLSAGGSPLPHSREGMTVQVVTTFVTFATLGWMSHSPLVEWYTMEA